MNLEVPSLNEALRITILKINNCQKEQLISKRCIELGLTMESATNDISKLS